MKFLTALLLSLFFALHAQAMDYKHFDTLPVLHEGRIKPLSSFAQSAYKTLHDVPYVGEDKALAFLAQALFDPAQSAEEKIITIRDPNLLRLLGLDGKRSEFALSELTEPLSKHDKDVADWLAQGEPSLSAEQKALISLYDKMVFYTQILRSFTLLLPMDIALDDDDKERYVVTNAVNFYALQSRDEQLRRDIDTLVKRKGRMLENYSEREQSLVELTYQLDQIRLSGAGNSLFRVIPNDWSADWLSPWETSLGGQASPHSAKIVAHWADMAAAWRANDEAGFTKASGKLSEVMSWEKTVHPWRLALEAFYYNAHLLVVSFALYLAALCALALRRKRTAVLIGSAALFLHAADITMRILILNRPPVGTLFESILFVGFVAALLLFLSERLLKNTMGVWLAMLIGAGLQLTAMGFAQNGDTLQNLQAVLNTPFWLAVHVLMISAGYGACVVASAFAQASLLWRGKIGDGLIWFSASVALLLTAIGTLLGGLWADQSWGRFWGWDPKENGALLIVLWLSWALHARLSGHLSPVWFKASIGMVSVVVAIAWFGVNMLSTGLHSYGFTSGVAGGLAAFILIQTALIGSLIWRERPNNEREA